MNQWWLFIQNNGFLPEEPAFSLGCLNLKWSWKLRGWLFFSQMKSCPENTSRCIRLGRQGQQAVRASSGKEEELSACARIYRSEGSHPCRLVGRVWFLLFPGKLSKSNVALSCCFFHDHNHSFDFVTSLYYHVLPSSDVMRQLMK